MRTLRGPRSQSIVQRLITMPKRQLVRLVARAVRQRHWGSNPMGRRRLRERCAAAEAREAKRRKKIANMRLEPHAPEPSWDPPRCSPPLHLFVVSNWGYPPAPPKTRFWLLSTPSVDGRGSASQKRKFVFSLVPQKGQDNLAVNVAVTVYIVEHRNNHHDGSTG